MVEYDDESATAAATTTTTTSTTTTTKAAAKNQQVQSSAGGPGGLVGGLTAVWYDRCIADCENPGFRCQEASDPPKQESTTRAPDIPWYKIFDIFDAATGLRKSPLLVFASALLVLGFSFLCQIL